MVRKILDSKGAFYNCNESDSWRVIIMMRVIMMNKINSSSYGRVLPIVATNSFTNSPTKIN